MQQVRTTGVFPIYESSNYEARTGLRRLIQIKNKELRQMKSLAATILDQRSDVEQFFLEALQEVGAVLCRARC